MSYLATLFTVLSIIIVIAFIFWGIPMLTREKPSSIKTLKEQYGEPPGLLRSLNHKDLGWSDMPGDFEGNSASSVSAHTLRSAN
jgi:hypothetical protein